MATLPFVPSTNLPVPYSAPDYSFLNTQVQKANQQYEQGLQQVESDYSSILSAPVTGDAMKERKNTYIKQFQDGLNSIAGTDLSLPKNQAQAQKILAPFWQDDLLLQNTSMTKYAHNQLDKLNSWQSSSDEDTRSQYSDYSKRDIEQGLEQLAMAPLDKNAYSRLQTRDATPFYNITADVDEALQKQVGAGWKGISTVTTNGLEMLTEYNGIKSKDAYSTFFLSKLASGKYDNQLKVMARVDNYDMKRNIRVNNPGIDEATLNAHYANDRLQQLGDAYKKTGDSYNKQAGYYTDLMGRLQDQIKNKQHGRMTDTDRANLEEYTRRISEYTAAGKQYSDEYWREYSPTTISGGRNEQYYKTLHGLTEYSDDYMAKLYRHQMADEWATGRASITETKREVDPVAHERWNQSNERWKNSLEQQRINATTRGQNLDFLEKTGIDAITGKRNSDFNPNSEHGWYGKGYGTASSTGPIPGANGQVVASNIIDPAKVPGGIDIIHGAIQQELDKTMAMTFNPGDNSLSGIVLRSMKNGDQPMFTNSEIIDFTEGNNKALRGQGLSPSENAAMLKVRTALKDRGVSTDIRGPHGFLQALQDYSASAALQLKNTGNDDDMAIAKKLAMVHDAVDYQKKKFIKNEENYTNAVNSTILNNPQFAPLTINDHGKKRMVDYKDIAQGLTDIKATDESGQPVTISKEDWAKAIANGTFNTYFGSPTSYAFLPIDQITGNPYDFSIGDKHYKLPKMGSAGLGLTSSLGFGSLADAAMREQYEKVMAPYGRTSQHFAELKKMAGEQVAKQMGIKNGIISKVQQWDTNASAKGNDNEEQFALGLAPELSYPGNTSKMYYYDNNGNKKELGPEEQGIVRQTLRNSADTKDLIGSISKTRNDENNPVFIANFQQASSKKQEKDNPLLGKAIYIEESPNATGRYMRSIPEGTDQYVYSELLEPGGEIRSSPILNNMGISYTWKGFAQGPDGKNTKSLVEIRANVPDQNHKGHYKQLPVVSQIIDHTGSNAKTVDEVGEGLNRSVISLLNMVESNTKQATMNFNNKTSQPQ